MMDLKDLPQGGPAFPTSNAHQNGPATFHFPGMTLRDYFAGQIASSDQYGSPFERAKWAYEVADAMLLERAK